MDEQYIPLSACVKGSIYRLDSRNLSYGVYDGQEGFIGIRLKFYDRYLFTEYHWDQGPPHGTAKPIEKIGDLPADIPVSESRIHSNGALTRPLPKDRGIYKGKPWTDNGWAWAIHPATKQYEAVTRRDQQPDEPQHGKRQGFVDEWAKDGTRLPDDLWPRGMENKSLFEYLDGLKTS